MEIDYNNLNDKQNLVLQSITHGKMEIYKTAKIQVFSSAISSIEDIDLSLKYIKSNERINSGLSFI